MSGDLVQDSLWLKPPSDDSSDGASDVGPNRRTILSSNRKLQQPTGDSSPSNSVVSSSGGIAAPVIFGCVTDERGQIFRQKADGILGLADEALSVPRQLSGSNATSDAFTICYGSHSGANSSSLWGFYATCCPSDVCIHKARHPAYCNSINRQFCASQSQA